MKIDTLAGYVKVEALADYIKTADADARYVKGDALADYIKSADADARFVEGDGSVVTGSRLVEDSPEPLLTVDKVLTITVLVDGDGKGARAALKNLTDAPLEYASTALDAAGAPEHGTIEPGGTESILIGLLLPATVQIIPGAGDGGAVHTLSLSAFELGGKLQVVGQALSGAPPRAAG